MGGLETLSNLKCACAVPLISPLGVTIDTIIENGLESPYKNCNPQIPVHVARKKNWLATGEEVCTGYFTGHKRLYHRF